MSFLDELISSYHMPFADIPDKPFKDKTEHADSCEPLGSGFTRLTCFPSCACNRPV